MMEIDADIKDMNADLKENNTLLINHSIISLILIFLVVLSLGLDYYKKKSPRSCEKCSDSSDKKNMV